MVNNKKQGEKRVWFGSGLKREAAKRYILAGLLSCALIVWITAWHLGAFRQLGFQGSTVYPKVEVFEEIRGLQPGDHKSKPLPVLPFEIDWPASSTIDLAIFSKLSPVSREVVESSAVPVLLPSNPKIFLPPEIFIWGGGHNLSVGLNYPDIPINMSVWGAGEGGGKAPSTPSPYMPDRIRGLPADIGQTEGGWYANWNEFGAAYYLEIRCFRVPKDSRCANDQYLRSVVENLHYVGGKGG